MREGFIERDVIEGKGIYCIYQFDNLDKNNKGVFKVGMTTSFHNRIAQNHTYSPAGIWLCAMLKNPTRNINNRTDAIYYREVEKFIFDDIVERGGIPIKMNIRRQNKGETEYIYTDIKTILLSFGKAEKKYGGTFFNYRLSKQKIERERISDDLFKGEIHFKETI
jgi:hypothetical protein